MELPQPLNASDPIDNDDCKNALQSEKRKWSNKDIDDATRIGVMIGGFLAAEPFRSETAFQERVTSLLRGSNGPQYGAVKRMKHIMSAVMVKHG